MPSGVLRSTTVIYPTLRIRVALKAQGKSPRSLRNAHPDRAEKLPVRVWIDAKGKCDYFKYVADRE